MADPTTFRVVLRAEGKGPPAIIRLRRWLKWSLRGYGLRAVSAVAVEVSADLPGKDVEDLAHERIRVT